MKEIFPDVFIENNKIFTKNLTPGEKVYGEDLIIRDDIEYRNWNYTRSKLAAGLKNGLKEFPLKKGMKVLYLGVASGTSASHFSDIINKEGLLYGVDIAERVLRELIIHAEKRENIVPILADSRLPENYSSLVLEKVDLVFEDVASSDQIEIFIRNCDYYLKQNGYAIIAIKSQSIDVTKDPEIIYKESLKELKKHLTIIDKVKLDPYEKHHLLVVLQKK